MTIPLVVLAVLSVIGGFINIPEVFTHGGERLSAFLSGDGGPIREFADFHVSHTTEWILMALTTIIALAAIFAAWLRYRNYKEEQPSAIASLLQNKWYVDELYEGLIVKPVNWLGRFASGGLERRGIDALVNGVGRLVHYGGRQLRWLQSGQVGSYVLLMVISMVLFFALQFFLRK